MSVMQIEPMKFCYVHGYAHPDGELDSVETTPPEFYVGPDHTLLPCHEEEWEVVVLDDDEFTAVKEERLRDWRPDYTLEAGDLAYIYTVRGGLVPCKVLSVSDNGQTEVKVTADRIGWKAGLVEVIRNPMVSLVNRSQVSYSRGQVRVHGALAMVSDNGILIR